MHTLRLKLLSETCEVDGLTSQRAVKALIFDFIGTLVKVVGYSREESLKRMYKSLVRDGLKADFKSFLEAYENAWQKYRSIRYQDFREITNAVWVAEALNNLGFVASPEDESVKKAVNAFFLGYLRAIKPRNCAQQILRKLSRRYKLGLISNFTYAPLIYAALRKVKLNSYFSVVLVSHSVGVRKPSPEIFRMALQKMGVRPEEAVFVGDSPEEDVEGAKKAGLKVVFVPSQFYTLEDLRRSSTKPDLIVKDLCKFPVEL